MPSLKASPQGLARIKHTRKAARWAIEDKQWLVAASQQLDPTTDWSLDRYASQGIFASGVSLSTWKRFLRGEPIHTTVFKAFCQMLALDWQDVVDRPSPLLSSTSSASPSTHAIAHQDWGVAPDVPVFFGRQQELATLEQWIVHDRCRLIAILGMGGAGKTHLSVKLGSGGMGKTDLSVKLAQGIQGEFEYVIWRSLLNAPPLTEMLSDLIRFLSQQQECQLPETLDQSLARLLHYLRTHRCLLILDNVETILQGGELTGHYRDGFEGYGQLLKQIGAVPHQSCLLLTSREKPRELVPLEGPHRPVRSLVLNGLDSTSSQKIFAEIGHFSGSPSDWEALSSLYSGNPLALELAAKHIHDVFGGKLSAFLQQGNPVFYDLRDLLDWHFDRLSHAEQEIMYWLAINREPVSVNDLKTDILSAILKDNVAETLQLLQRRLPLERLDECFTLQPVLIEYVTERLIKSSLEEFRTGIINLLNRCALIKASAKEYIRESQKRLVLDVLKTNLIENIGSEFDLECRIKDMLQIVRMNSTFRRGYASGNLLNLLCQPTHILRDYDLSELIIRQANLQDTKLHDVNFTNATFIQSMFTQALGIVNASATSPDNQYLATGDFSGEVRLWDVANSQHLLSYGHHDGWVTGIAFSPDGKMLASCGDDRVTKIWNTHTGHLLKILSGHTAQVNAITFHPSEQILISASDDQTVRLWNLDTGNYFKTLQDHNAPIKSLSLYSADFLVTGSHDQTVKLWNLKTDQCLRTLRGHSHYIWTVVTIPSHIDSSISSEWNWMIASGSEDCTVKLWNAETGKCIRTFQGHTQPVRSIASNPQGTLLASGSYDKTIRLWELITGQCLHVFQGHDAYVRSVAFSSDGTVLISSSEDQKIKFWSSDGLCLRTIQGYTNWIHTVAFSPDGATLASGGEEGIVKIWDRQTAQCLRRLKGHNAWVNSVTFSPNGVLIASGGNDQTIRFWNKATGQIVETLHGHSASILSVALSPDGQQLASSSSDQTIKLWDVDTGKCLMTFLGHADWVRSVAFNPQEPILASSSDDQTIRLWHRQTGQCLKSLIGHENWVWTIAFSPDGELLASGSEDQTIRLWEIHSGQCLRILRGHKSWIRAVAFSPDGELLASGSEDQTIRLWEVSTGKCLKTLVGHTKRVRCLAFSPNEQILASASEDETIKLWDISITNQALGQCLSTIRDARPYEGMDITGVQGLTEAEMSTLRALGAIASTPHD